MPRSQRCGRIRAADGGRGIPRGALWIALVLSLCGAGTSAATSSAPSLRILGFYDFNYFATDASDSGVVSSGFEKGQLVFHTISSLSDRTSFFSELSLTPASPYKVNVERAILKFELNDRFKLSFGRYHTPINWWNTAFHHGLWLQTSIRRPEMTQFGGKFIPVHFVGVLAHGALDGPGASLDYELGVGNGRAASISGAGDSGDANGNRAVLAHAFIRPDRLYALKLGGAFYKDKITGSFGGEAPGTSDLREWIASGYLVLTREDPEILFELAVANHEDDAGGEYESVAYYGQLAYRLPWREGLFKPYARYEEMDIEDADPVFATVPDLERYIFGLRADVSTFVAMKAEYRRDRENESEWINGLYLQLSLVF
jgi:hypothetical protein